MGWVLLAFRRWLKLIFKHADHLVLFFLLKDDSWCYAAQDDFGTGADSIPDSRLSLRESTSSCSFAERKTTIYFIREQKVGQDCGWKPQPRYSRGGFASRITAPCSSLMIRIAYSEIPSSDRLLCVT